MGSRHLTLRGREAGQGPRRRAHEALENRWEVCSWRQSLDVVPEEKVGAAWGGIYDS